MWQNSNPLAIACAASLLIGCGGGGSSSSSTPAPTTPEAYTLTAIDGYLYKADVCIDANVNNLCDDGETVIGTTDESGEFDVPSANAGDKLVVRIVENKTIDQDDGLPIDRGYSLSASIGSLVITPFTHIAEVQGKSLTEVAADFGLSEEDISGDYIEGKSGTNSTVAKQVHKVAQFLADQLASDVEVNSSLIDNAVALKEEIDTIIASDPNVDVDNIDFEVDSDGNVTQTERPSLDYSFEQETEYFTIWYNTFDDECNGDRGWVVERVRYVPAQGETTSGQYSLAANNIDGCTIATAANPDYDETGPFVAAGNRMTWDVPNSDDESSVRLNYISKYKAFDTCFFEAVGAVPTSCTPSTGQTYEVESQADAEALLAVLQAQDEANTARLVGSWDLGLYTPDLEFHKAILTFTADGEFFFFDNNPTGVNDDANCRETGYEWGTYQRTGNQITLQADIDTDSCVGIFDAIEGEVTKNLTVISELENELAVSFVDPQDILVAITFDRIATSATSIVGAWHEPLNEGPDGDNNLSNLLVYTDDGWFFFMDSDPDFVTENDFAYGEYSFSAGSDPELTTTFRYSEFDELNVEGTVSVRIENGRLYFELPEENGYGLLQVPQPE